MWRNVYRLPDGRYGYGGWWKSKSWALFDRWYNRRVVYVGIMHVPTLRLREAGL